MSGTRPELHWHLFASEELNSQLVRLEQELKRRAEQIVASDSERPPESSDVVYERDVRRAADNLLRRPTFDEPFFVFLSYAREDERYAVEVYSALQQADVRTFMDSQSIDPGDNWKEVIRSSMARCRYCLCILTRAALTSEWCKKEISMAHEEDRVTILPALRYIRGDEAESTFPKLSGIQNAVLETEVDKHTIVRFLKKKSSEQQPTRALRER